MAVLPVRYGRPEHGHETVTEELVDDPLVAVDAIHHELEKRIEIVHNLGGVRFLRVCREVADVEKHQADVPHLAILLDILGEERVHDLR